MQGDKRQEELRSQAKAAFKRRDTYTQELEEEGERLYTERQGQRPRSNSNEMVVW